jgi:hypothetical protein
MAPRPARPATSPPVKGSVPPPFFAVVAAASTATAFVVAGSPLVAAGSLGSPLECEPADGLVVVVVVAFTAWVLVHDGLSATSMHNAPSPPPSLVGVSGQDAATGAPDSVA